MANDNYASSSELIRNLSQITTGYEVVHEAGLFRIVQFPPPYFGGYEYWVVNEKGFLWEPANDLASAHIYLDSDEAKEYQTDTGSL